MFYFKIDPESYKNTWWANLYVIMADGHRLKDAVMGLFENCVFPTRTFLALQKKICFFRFNTNDAQLPKFIMLWII